MECGVRSVGKGMWSVEWGAAIGGCKVWRAECEVQIERRVWGVEWEWGSTNCGVRSAECRVESEECGG